jgi:hypothetical protein
MSTNFNPPDIVPAYPVAGEVPDRRKPDGFTVQVAIAGLLIDISAPRCITSVAAWSGSPLIHARSPLFRVQNLVGPGLSISRNHRTVGTGYMC